MPDDFDLRGLAPDLDDLGGGVLGRVQDSEVFYPADGHAGCLAVEDDSWWFAHRNQVLVDLLGQYPPGPTLLDIGGGNGCVARALELAGHRVVLLEPGSDGIRAAQGRGLRHLIKASLEHAQLRPQSASAAGLFDVLEHVPDETQFLGQISRVLEPRGRLYLTVPAHAWLWSHADVSAGHQRRYTRKTLTQVLEQAEFEVESISYFFAFLLLPLWLGRTLPDKFRAPPETRQAQSEKEHRPPSWVGQVVRWTCQLERRALGATQLPLGASVVAVARKKQ